MSCAWHAGIGFYTPIRQHSLLKSSSSSLPSAQWVDMEESLHGSNHNHASPTIRLASRGTKHKANTPCVLHGRVLYLLLLIDMLGPRHSTGPCNLPLEIGRHGSALSPFEYFVCMSRPWAVRLPWNYCCVIHSYPGFLERGDYFFLSICSFESSL